MTVTGARPASRRKMVRGAKDGLRVPAVPSNADPENVVTVNFVADGLTAFAQVWYRGQELSVLKGSPEWEQTLMDPEDSESSWLLLTEDEQVARWGERKFKEGHWAGAGFDIEDENLTETEKKVLAEANAKLLAGTSTEVLDSGAPKKRGPGRPPKVPAKPAD